MQCGLVSLGFMTLNECQFCTWHKGRQEQAVCTRCFVEQINSFMSIILHLTSFWCYAHLITTCITKNSQTIFSFLFSHFPILFLKRFCGRWSNCDILKLSTLQPTTVKPYGTSAGHNMVPISCCIFWKHWKQWDGTIQNSLQTVLLSIIGNLAIYSVCAKALQLEVRVCM